MARRGGNNVSTRSPTGRYEPVYDWSDVIARLSKWIAEGGNIRDFCDLAENPGFPQIYCRIDGNPDFKAEYRAAQGAKAEGLDRDLDALLDTIKAAMSDKEQYLDARLAKVMLDTLRLQRVHLAPQRYHDRSVTQLHTHQIDEGIRARIERADQRTKTIDGTADGHTRPVNGDERPGS